MRLIRGRWVPNRGADSMALATRAEKSFAREKSILDKLEGAKEVWILVKVVVMMHHSHERFIMWFGRMWTIGRAGALGWSFKRD